MGLTGLKIGNGWMISILILVIFYGPMLFGNKENVNQLLDYSFCTYGKFFLFLLWVGMVFPMVYGVFLDADFGTVSFFAGALMMITGTAVYVFSAINYFSTPPDQPIIKGMYRISRNPLYISATILFIGMAVILRSPVIGVSVCVNLILQHFVILDEERFCQTRYGNAYLAFKNRVPRYLFF